NVDFLRTGQSRSLSATETALRDAGVTHATPLVITGHSQGGLIGLALASSGRYTVDAVFTIGTPVGVVADPLGVPTVHVAHPEDLVPALGGTVRNASGTTWFVHPDPRVLGADAHRVENYRSSSEAVVQLGDPALQSLESRIHAPTVGTATWFRAMTSG
ncbi:MAG: alpha/beta fold hydrolase, partial [Microbacteriaceae bacterium]|nr:alpha/beta fold hydrolase [Microbacteriaceae bacterium]